MFEMTASLLMQDAGRSQTVLKCPDELRAILGRGADYLTVNDGLNLRQWVDGGSKVDSAVEKVRSSLQMVTESGLTALEAAWTATPAKIRGALGRDFLGTLKTSAIAYDEQRNQFRRQADAPDVIASLNSQVASAAEAPSTDTF